VSVKLAMTCTDALELIGSLVWALKGYAARLPPVVNLSTMPGGLRPTPEVVEAYEQAVSRFRHQSGGSIYRRFNDQLIESLEAFEGGKLLGAIQPLLAVLDLLDVMDRDHEITVIPADKKRLGEYRMTLNKILPGNQPELEGAGRGMV
jgi:hypothetical protein